MTRSARFNANFYGNSHRVGAASLKTVLAIAAALFAICLLNLLLSVLSASWAHAADLDAPRQLEPRFDLQSNSAPSRGRRVHSPQLIGSTTIVQCVHLTVPRERQDCMLRASAGAWSYLPSTTSDGGMPTVVVSGESK